MSVRLPASRRPRVGDDRFDVAAVILSEAFHDYPEMTATLVDPIGRRAGLPLMWRCVARHVDGLRHGAVEFAERDGQPAGVAVWCDPEGADVGWVETVTQGYLRFGLAAGVRNSIRLMDVQAETMRHHRDLLDEPHLYLMALGVLPAWQGRGVGAELVQRCCDRADELGWPVFLETNLSQNVRLYRRHGFLVVREEEINGLATTFMIRPATR